MKDEEEEECGPFSTVRFGVLTHICIHPQGERRLLMLHLALGLVGE